MKGVFVVGTDTGVGKTTVSVGMVAALAERGLRVAAMKPCETGGGDDAARLLLATGRDLDPSLVNPYRFPLPAAPEVAAREAGVQIELDHIAACHDRLRADADFVWVEGAGGLLVPFAPGVTTAELIARLALPALVVARTRLGTINHTLLTIEVIRRRGLPLLGVVFCQSQPDVGPEEHATIETILAHGALRSFGLLPWLPAEQHDAGSLAAHVRRHLAIDALLEPVK